jgi:hypothetical protein
MSAVNRTEFRDVTKMTPRQKAAESAWLESQVETGHAVLSAMDTKITELVQTIAQCGNSYLKSDEREAAHADKTKLKSQREALATKLEPLKERITLLTLPVVSVEPSSSAAINPVIAGHKKPAPKTTYRNRAYLFSALQVVFLISWILGVGNNFIHHTMSSDALIAGLALGTVGMIGFFAARHFCLKNAGKAFAEENGDPNAIVGTPRSRSLERYCFTTRKAAMDYLNDDIIDGIINFFKARLASNPTPEASPEAVEVEMQIR